MRKNKTLKIILLGLLFMILSGFVLLSGPKEARLPASPEEPDITFVWNGDAPSISKKDKFEDGLYEDSSDEDTFRAILEFAMGKWSDVQGSYLKFILEQTSEETKLDRKDGVFSIVIEKETNIAVAASSMPEVNGSTIKDCDVKVPKRKVDAQDLAYTLVHELGHCLGLGHNHSNYNSIMGYARSGKSTNLSLDDMAGVMYLYPDPAVFDGKEPKEMINCGQIKYQNNLPQPPSQLFWALFLLTVPLFVIFFVKTKTHFTTHNKY